MDMKTSPLATLNDPGLLKTDALIGGEWVAGSARFDVTDPATGLKLADVANLGPVDCHNAIVAAERAWAPWRAKTAKERAAIYVSMMAHRIAIASAIGSTLLLIWVNLAVGLIGSGGHAGNLMYAGVVAIAIISTILSRFKPKGMQYAMFAVVGSLALLTAIAFMANMHHYPGSSSAEILGVNAFFATLFAISGLLFRYVALEESSEKTAG